MTVPARRIFAATIRPRRQVTLPGAVCRALGVEVGDSIELELLDAGVLVRARKDVALDALREIQRAFATHAASADAIETERQLARQRATRRRYGDL